ncbi:hypothetical protein PsAD2_00107 [Pseudovibrio axinellae]|uniref:Uncharacterized protein n=1 Tax=Pseudovibrio axinellae TaxID=989403 RepID=A0A166BAZ0_9HYPH|nr:hypothetical protein [Pseudovibrio axinellae]KZL22082.1 hypothetical protein PsAD2_00107 [Pseudovibrio axinellae]SEQ56004.1 hypothetical protein SAMN05421798_10392 [Pseudovibrio axinellae]
MKTPTGVARAMTRPAPLPKRSCLNEDAKRASPKAQRRGSHSCQGALSQAHKSPTRRTIMDTGGDFYSDVHAQRHWESFEDWWWYVGW